MPPSASPSGPTPEERREWRDALLTFVPPALVGFALERGLTVLGGWPRQRAIWAGLLVGVVLALVLQRLLAHRGRP